MADLQRRASSALARLSLALASASVLGACAPDLGPKPALVTPSAIASQKSLAAPRADWPTEAWWKSYNDPQLDALIEEGLKSSPTVREAAGRLRAAQGLAGQYVAASRPSLAAEGGVMDFLQSKNMGYPAFFQQFLPGSFRPLGSVNVDFAYNLDLFGKQRALIAAASSEAEATAADLAEARLALSTAIAAAYADLGRLQKERDAAAHMLEVRRQMVAVVAARAAHGVETQGELRTQSINIPAAELEIQNLDRQIALARNQLAALVGKGPDAGLDIVPTGAAPALHPLGLPEALPAELIGRRPDIVAARLRARAQAKRITAAKADFYPNIDLTAAVGFESLGLANLFKETSREGQFGPALNLPIYSGGAASAGYSAAYGQADTAAAAYDQTLLLAIKDVSDALINRRALESELVQARKALDHARDADRLMKARVEAGIANRTLGLATEAAVIAQERTLSDLESLAFTYDVALVRALGGGYAEPAHGRRKS